jgi:hypothetical protein
MTEWQNTAKEGDLIAHFRANNLKVSKAVISIDKLMPRYVTRRPGPAGWAARRPPF